MRRSRLVKRLFVPGIILLALVSLTYWSNGLLARALDARLPPLLSRELGLPVSLAPTQAWIPKLAVHSPRLVMGDPAEPALVATGVSVALDWGDLLRGEIRLRRVTGTNLEVTPSRFPTSDTPWPENYTFIEPFLPDYLALDSARYVFGDGGSHTFSKPQWRRTSAGIDLQWADKVDEKTVGLVVELHSLDELLDLQSLQLQVVATPQDNPADAISGELDIRSARPRGYTVQAAITAKNLHAAIESGNSAAWQLPPRSSITIERLDIVALTSLLESFSGTDDETDLSSWLETKLPELVLPEHTSHITVGELRWHDEVLLDANLDISTDAHGLVAPTISARGAGGILQGSAGLATSPLGWEASATASISATQPGQSLAVPFAESEWSWHQGSTTLAAKGDTWGALLYSLGGQFTLAGGHRGVVVTPIDITGTLDNRAGAFGLDTIEIAVGQGRITGSAMLSGTRQRRLSANIKAEQLNLDFLIPPPAPTAAPGIEIPEFLGGMTGVDLDLQLEVDKLTAQDLHINKATLALTRTSDQGKLIIHSTGASHGKIDLQLAAQRLPDDTFQMDLETVFSSVDLPRIFGQTRRSIDSRTSGTVGFSGQGDSWLQIFAAMRGSAELVVDLRPDQDWERAPIPENVLRISGNAALVLADNRVTGLKISKLAMDSILQNITGTVSMVGGRKPWLEADLSSNKLDINRLRSFTSDIPAGEQDTDMLQAIRNLGETRLSLKAKSLFIYKLQLTELSAELMTTRDNITIDQLDFSLDRGRVASRGALLWRKDNAMLSIDASVADLAIDRFLVENAVGDSVPLSGTLSLKSAGKTLDDLLAGLTGDIKLTSAIAAKTAAHVEMTASRSEDGMHALVRRFQWQGSDLAGSIDYHQTTRPLLELKISGGTLSLLPWEAADSQPDPTGAAKDEGSIVSRTAAASASLISDVVMAPLRLVSGPREAEPGDKLFSNTPLPFDWLRNYQARISGRLDTLSSRRLRATDLEFSATLLDEKLDVKASAGQLNEGSASLNLALDATAQQPTLAASGVFMNVRDPRTKAGFPRSGYFDMTSRGQNQAELAANISGTAYLELGAGPLDYDKMILLTADVATSALRNLIPGSEKEQPQLECAITLGSFKDGIGSTPFGYAARTHQANLVGQVEIDLKKELLHMNFNSSNRQGVGISVSSVFSNTVEIEGPLTAPKIIPNATGLLWRGWAAVMTGGLSVVGESVLKRALASEDPCASVRKQIHNKFCGTPEAAGTPAMVCPPA